MIQLEEKDSVRKILNHAYATSKEISSEKERVEVLCDIAEIMLEMEQKSGAKKILGEAFDRSKNISSASFRALVLCDIAKIFGKVDEEKRAGNLLHKALEGFEHISFSIDQKARALAEITGTMAKIGEVDIALSLAEELSNKYGRAA
ncbi:MAG: hypothetical protein V5A88_09870, partial [Candidatus Thermoplasmatota archaeon]